MIIITRNGQKCPIRRQCSFPKQKKLKMSEQMTVPDVEQNEEIENIFDLELLEIDRLQGIIITTDDVIERLQSICNPADPTRLYKKLVKIGQGYVLFNQ